jgi:hypothetical protein
MRYDFKAEGRPSDPDEAAVRSGAVFYALAMRGVAHHVALMIAERLEHGEAVEDETEMEAQGIHAEWRGGEPRQPFTLDLVPNHERWRGVWPKAVGSALKTRGLAEDEADDIAVRLAAGDRIERVVLRWVPSEDEELVIEQLEGYGAMATKVAGG